MSGQPPKELNLTELNKKRPDLSIRLGSSSQQSEQTIKMANENKRLREERGEKPDNERLEEIKQSLNKRKKQEIQGLNMQYQVSHDETEQATSLQSGRSLHTKSEMLSSYSSEPSDNSSCPDKSSEHEEKPDLNSLTKAILDYAENKCRQKPNFPPEVKEELIELFKQKQSDKEITIQEYRKALKVIKELTDKNYIKSKTEKNTVLSKKYHDLRERAKAGDKDAKEKIRKHNDTTSKYHTNIRERAKAGDKDAKRIVKSLNDKSREYRIERKKEEKDDKEGTENQLAPRSESSKDDNSSNLEKTNPD